MSSSPLHENLNIHNNSQDDLIASSYEKELPSSKRIKLTHIEHTSTTTVLSKSVTNIANGNHNQV